LARYMHRFLIAVAPAALAAIVISITAGTAGATIVCPPGQTNPLYCHNVPPIAQTRNASDVGQTQARVQGTAGPNVNNGDITTYYFQYGKTKSYGHRTPSGTIGHCPPGVTAPQYCTTPATKSVSALIRGLDPNTVYHYRLVATNPDGTTHGDDRTFKTHAIPPIQSVSVPQKVNTGQKFFVTVTLRSGANVTIKFNGQTFREGFSNRKVTQKLFAPHRKGVYTVTVKAVGDETETVQKQVQVVSPHRGH
jgi:hypothetical protein